MGDRLIRYLVLLSMLLACDDTDTLTADVNSRRIEALIQYYEPAITLDDLKAILVVSEEGCLTCNRAFAHLAEAHLSDSTILLWMSAVGTGLDISSFKAHRDRIIWDLDDLLKKEGLLLGSGAILLKNARIDTIIRIDARNLGQTLDHLAALMDGPVSAPMDYAPRNKGQR